MHCMLSTEMKGTSRRRTLHHRAAAAGATFRPFGLATTCPLFAGLQGALRGAAAAAARGGQSDSSAEARARLLAGRAHVHHLAGPEPLAPAAACRGPAGNLRGPAAGAALPANNACGAYLNLSVRVALMASDVCQQNVNLYYPTESYCSKLLGMEEVLCLVPAP